MQRKSKRARRGGGWPGTSELPARGKGHPSTGSQWEKSSVHTAAGRAGGGESGRGSRVRAAEERTGEGWATGGTAEDRAAHLLNRRGRRGTEHRPVSSWGCKR